jgi:hypothetical protein
MNVTQLQILEQQETILKALQNKTP